MGNTVGNLFGYDTQPTEPDVDQSEQEEEQKFQACLDKSSPTSNTIVISGISQPKK